MPKLPANTELFKKKHPEIWSAFEELSKQCYESGPIDEKTRRLVKVALAIGAGVESSAHSAVRHAKELVPYSGAKCLESRANQDKIARHWTR